MRRDRGANALGAQGRVSGYATKRRVTPHKEKHVPLDISIPITD